jgi:hypothetical protein
VLLRKCIVTFFSFHTYVYVRKYLIIIEMYTSISVLPMYLSVSKYYVNVEMDSFILVFSSGFAAADVEKQSSDALVLSNHCMTILDQGITIIKRAYWCPS